MDPKLAQKWARKLKQAGFEDIEDNNGMLKQWHSHYFRARYTPERFVDISEYYRACGLFLHTHHWDGPGMEVRTIKRFKASGWSYKRIAADLGVKEIWVRQRLTTALIERQVWELHAAGLSNQRIGDQLGIHRDRAWAIVKKYRGVMIAERSGKSS